MRATHVDGSGRRRRASVSASGGRARSAPKKNRDDELDGSGKSLTSAKVAEAAAAAANPQGGRAEWMKRVRERVLPPLRAFKPDLLIISAGFDAANHDVGNMGVDKTGKRLAGINLQPGRLRGDDSLPVRGGGFVQCQSGVRARGWVRVPNRGPEGRSGGFGEGGSRGVCRGTRARFGWVGFVLK